MTRSAIAPTVAIIGSGLAGLSMATQLQKAGIHSFTIFEKSGRVGGTWRDNTGSPYIVSEWRCQVVRAIRRQALNRLVTTTDGRFGRDRPHAATANAVVSETTSHSRQRRRIIVR